MFILFKSFSHNSHLLIVIGSCLMFLTNNSKCYSQINTKLNQKVVNIEDFQGYINHISFSPTGQLLAAAGKFDIAIYDCKNKKTVRVIRQSVNSYKQIEGLSFIKDDDTLLIAYLPGQIHKYDLNTDKKTIYRFPTGVFSLCLSPDKSSVAVGTGDGIEIWDNSFKEKQCSLQSRSGVITCFYWSSESKLLVSGNSTGLVQIWNIHKEKEVGSFKCSDEDSPLRSVSIELGGKTIFASYLANTLINWDLGTKKILWKSENAIPGRIMSTASQKNGIIVIGKDKSLDFLDLKNNTIVKTFTSDFSINSLAFSEDRKALAIGYGNHQYTDPLEEDNYGAISIIPITASP